MRTVSFMAEPTPAWASGSELMIDSVAGAMVAPMPKPSRTSAAASDEYPVAASDAGHEDHRGRDDRQAAGHHEAGAEALRELRGQRSAEHQPERHGRHAQARARAARSP